MIQTQNKLIDFESFILNALRRQGDTLTHKHTYIRWQTKQVILTNLNCFKQTFAIFRSVKSRLVERITWLWITAFMLIVCGGRGGCFVKRETERLLRGQTKACLKRRPLVWPENPLWSRRGLRHILLKGSPIKSSLSPPPPLSLCCVHFWESCQKRERGGGREGGGDNKSRLPACPPLLRDRSFLCWGGAGPRCDTLTLLPDVKLNTERWTSTAFTTTE